MKNQSQDPKRLSTLAIAFSTTVYTNALATPPHHNSIKSIKKTQTEAQMLKLTKWDGSFISTNRTIHIDKVERLMNQTPDHIMKKLAWSQRGKQNLQHGRNHHKVKGNKLYEYIKFPQFKLWIDCYLKPKLPQISYLPKTKIELKKMFYCITNTSYHIYVNDSPLIFSQNDLKNPTTN